MTVKSLIIYAGRKRWLVFLVSALFLMAVAPPIARPEANETNKQVIVHQVAQDWIKAGTEQYERGFYKAAEQSLLRAQDYKDYLTNEERENLKQLLGKTRTAALEKERILGEIRTANELAKQGKALDAKKHLENVKGSEFLTEEEQELITKSLDRINKELGTEPAAPAAVVKAKEEVKEEPKEVNRPPAETNVKDVEDKLLGTKAETAAVKKAEEPVAAGAGETQVAISEVGKTTADEGNYIEAINRRRNVIRSHTKALVNDAITKAETCVSKGDFGEAKEIITKAEWTMNENQLHIGKDAFDEYARQMKQLREKIVGEQEKSQIQLQQQKQIEAQESQRRYLEQVEADRKKRIAELMGNAQACMKQQRYEEALGQLESLLALDPLSNEALILKDTLDDTINFQKQLEIQKEANKQRVKILKESDESAVPYAQEFRLPGVPDTLPKNWYEIVATRKPKEPIGREPANEAVYKSLERVVDLSDFTPTMPFSQAIERLKNSVEPSLNINPNWKDLYDNADIDKNTEINMDPISAVPLGAALGFLLESVGGLTKLGYTVKDGVIIIATVESLPSKKVTQVYEISDLVGAAANFGNMMIPLQNVAVGGGGAGGTGGGGAGGGRGGAGGGGGGGGGAGGVGGVATLNSSEQDLVGTTTIQQNAADIILLIQDSVDPPSWYDAGGTATIRTYPPGNPTKLVVYQTLENHKEIQKRLDDMRRLLTEQVAIEARFLILSENFLEEIGIDLDFPHIKIGGKFGAINLSQNSLTGVTPVDTGIEGSLAGIVASTITGGYGSILDDLQATFLIRATQGHTDSKILNAPKVTVLNGESATVSVQKEMAYISNWTINQITGAGGVGAGNIISTQWLPTVGTTQPGVVLNVTPTISADRKYVILRITTSYAELKEMKDFQFGQVGSGVTVQNLVIQVPTMESAVAQTRVSVPDRGTLLIGGQKISGQAEREQGVPVLSKVPFIGRLFGSRSKIRDDRILLILVKPTIIIPQEFEEQAVASLEKGL
jgi:tetratricopeptide (TPR) repeat protein